MPPREFVLRKSCKNNLNLIERKQMIIVTLFGQITFDIIRKKCLCHDLLDDLLLNGIFPSSPQKPSNFIYISQWIST